MSSMPDKPESNEPSQFFVESLRASTRSLRFLFLLILGLSFLVGYSIFQQPWWIIERVDRGIDTFERFEKLHRDFRNEPALKSAVHEKYEKLQKKVLSLAGVFDRLKNEHPHDYKKLEKKLESSLTTVQIEYLEALLDEGVWDKFTSVVSYIRTNDTEQLSFEYLNEFAFYFYPDFWQGFYDYTIALLKQFNEHSAGLGTDSNKQGLITIALGRSWDADLDWWKIKPWTVIRDAKLGVDWEDRLYHLPSLERLLRSSVVLDTFCSQYDIDPCSLNSIRISLGEKGDENVLRNLKMPYLGKSMGNLQIVLGFPFISFTLVLMLYLQIRRRKALLKTLAGNQLYHDIILLDAPTIFSNIELFARSDLACEKRAASTGLRLMVMLSLGYTLLVAAVCVFYVGQEVYFEVMLAQVAREAETEWKSIGLSVSFPFLEFPWPKLIAVMLWILGSVATGIMGTWITWFIWKELNNPKGITKKSV